MNRVIVQIGEATQGHTGAVTGGELNASDSLSRLPHDALGESWIEGIVYGELQIRRSALDQAIDVEVKGIDADITARENRGRWCIDRGL